GLVAASDAVDDLAHRTPELLRGPIVEFPQLLVRSPVLLGGLQGRTGEAAVGDRRGHVARCSLYAVMVASEAGPARLQILEIVLDGDVTRVLDEQFGPSAPLPGIAPDIVGDQAVLHL